MKKVLIVFGILAALVILPVAAFGVNWISKAASVVAEQVDPARLLREYETFKEIHASLASKKQGIDVLQAKVDTLVADYEGVSRKDWPRDDRQALNQMRSERSGMVLIFNDLAADYNARTAKINFRFCNVGDLPQGATEPLPRNYVLYVSK
jgi:hypothetical protein